MPKEKVVDLDSSYNFFFGHFFPNLEKMVKKRKILKMYWTNLIEDVFYNRLYLPAEYDFIRKKIKYSQVPEEISKRETEILNLIAQEKTSSEIAGLLNISVNTVETHRKHLFEKFQVSNLAGLIKAGFERGYLH